jgi:hypothetical protein
MLIFITKGLELENVQITAKNKHMQLVKIQDFIKELIVM